MASARKAGRARPVGTAMTRKRLKRPDGSGVRVLTHPSIAAALEWLVRTLTPKAALRHLKARFPVPGYLRDNGVIRRLEHRVALAERRVRQVALVDRPDDRAAEAVRFYPGALAGQRLLVVVRDVVALLRALRRGEAQVRHFRQVIPAARAGLEVARHDVPVTHRVVAGDE